MHLRHFSEKYFRYQLNERIRFDRRRKIERARRSKGLTVEAASCSALKTCLVRIVRRSDRPRQTFVPAPEELAHYSDLGTHHRIILFRHQSFC